MPKLTISLLLKKLAAEARSKAQFHIAREGVFRGVLKAAFIKAYEFTRNRYGIEAKSADEGCFFATSALRGVCEDLIALKFLRRLPKKERDEVITIKMLIGIAEASAKQNKFFKEHRPFQPVLQVAEDHRLMENRARLTSIGHASRLWKTEGKLPPIEQMAIKVNLRRLYDFIYSITSEVVHFSPRVALRSGWGNLPTVAFSNTNFSRYYLAFSQTYGLYLFVLFCFTFRKDLALSDKFMAHIRKTQALQDEEMRWPEAVTFEEINQADPGPLLRAVLRVAHQDRRAKKHRKKPIKNHGSQNS